MNRPASRRQGALLLFGFWTLIGLSFAAQFYISSAKAGVAVSWKEAVTSSLCDWYVFAALSWPVVWLSRLFPFDRRLWYAGVAVHVPASVLFSFLYMPLRAGLAVGQGWLDGRPVGFTQALQPLLVKTWHFNLLIYWVIVMVTHALDYYRKYRERELRTVELEARLTQARLQALQMQLNPHFLFNTLHAVSALMHKNVDAADRMMTRLSDLLRYALESTSAQEVTLKEELAFLERYLEIEKTRFGDRLTVRMDIAPETLEARVPNLILQPLVENAIRHGIEPHARPGMIELRARREGSRLVLVVQDNGKGLARDVPFVEGVGLSNTRARLRQLYGDAHSFELGDAPGGGLCVRLTLPS